MNKPLTEKKPKYSWLFWGKKKEQDKKLKTDLNDEAVNTDETESKEILAEKPNFQRRSKIKLDKVEMKSEES